MGVVLLNDLDEWIEEHFVNDLGIERVVPISGGDINRCFKLESYASDYFLKVNQKESQKDFLEKEALSLKLINKTGGLKVPKVLSVGKEGKYPYMLLEWIERAEPDKPFWENFGAGLAQMHQTTYPFHGFVTDNYIGTLKQDNIGCNTWSDFFVNHRLVPLVKSARDKGIIDEKTVERFDSLYIRIPEVFEEEKPSLLHGDFWYGNYMCDSAGDAVIFDPASYFGNRIMDIAMSKLFGGFPDNFYHAYNTVWHLPFGWQKAVEVANFYPLLVHANLFGGSYAEMVKQSLARY
jgi:fructosamine-3-kinase